MLHKNYIQSILNFFTSMNIDNLRLFLSERYSYANTKQEIFLNEIERIFETYRNSGDTELLIFEGTYAGRPFENCGISNLFSGVNLTDF